MFFILPNMKYQFGTCCITLTGDFKGEILSCEDSTHIYIQESTPCCGVLTLIICNRLTLFLMFYWGLE